ncbi:MAG: SDR family NAD(P)-dependent oxidoreductase [Candidatus Hadarchaeum sp.]|uniref:NAD-dependent epimerase/dehydratase family protein n=1 Tax=Candidatus Hadarchaeum sp. TaxID=2883567 RepID=UPI003175F6F9
MRVLVTGGAGFIGSHLVDALLSRGYSVTVLDNFSTGSEGNISHHLDNKNFRLVRGDVRDQEAVRSALDGAEAVVHLAALISVPLSLKEPALTHEVNVEGTLTLLRASLEAGVTRFVFASSCAIYGEAKKLPIKEETPPEPLSPYASSKLEAERACLAFFEANAFPVVSLRYFNVYGPRQTGGDYAGVMLKFIERLRENQPPVIYGDGNQTRDFIYVTDVVGATLLALERPGVEGEAINVGTMRRTSVNELCELFLKLARRPKLRPRYEAARPGDIRHSQADITKARELLGFRPKVSVESGVKMLLRTQGVLR